MSAVATPPQPPKESTYTQPSNPVDQTPAEQDQQKKHGQDQQQDQPGSDLHREGTQYRSTFGPRARGDAIPSIHRTPDSRPSDRPDAQIHKQRERERKLDLGGRDVDTEYGVEQQPAEGDIAGAVEGTRKQQRAQAGAHAGPVGSAQGPGAPAPAAGEERDLVADMGRKREEHDRVLGERGGKSPAAPEEEGQGQGQEQGVEAERERLRQRKLKEDEQVDVKGAVGKGTENVVVGGS
ncbi:hypothetical protein VTN00DRAFT_5269 [Thermoascus crustaceus]|uniref:uncharacterized protein n=1 Tax=Thermoascus crustaceus TaxID=5088 RepID=UPI0037435B5D